MRTRVIIDARSSPCASTAAKVAGSFDLDVVALVPERAARSVALVAIDTALAEWSARSHLSVERIPEPTPDAASAVSRIARSHDVLVTESSPVALEALRNLCAAFDNRGGEYTEGNIFEKLAHYEECRRLKEQGIEPGYSHRRYGKEERRRLRMALSGAISARTGIRPRDERPPDASMRAMRPCVDAGGTVVFVDGDACPVVAQILEVCGKAGAPIVFVSNSERGDLVAHARKKGFLRTVDDASLPPLTVQRVPKGSDEADRYIWEHVRPGDIAVTEDLGLMAECLARGAIVVDSRGRVLRPGDLGEPSRVSVRGVLRSLGERGKPGKAAGRRRFRESLQLLV